jgi:8-oxo-dGTP pyrophosphatase MutT (NUDIX family)
MAELGIELTDAVPKTLRSGVLRIVLIERSAHGRHGGQIALPGGRREPGDQSLRATAVRGTPRSWEFRRRGSFRY